MVAAEEELLVEETELSDEDGPLNVRYDITSYPVDYTVRTIYRMWQDGSLVIPEYQGRYVWNMTQASRLIESFLMGLPVPQVFLYRELSNPHLIVIDGQHRLGTIARFYNGEFHLRGVDSTWLGKKYDDLIEYDRLELDDSILRAVIIRQIQPNDTTSVYQIFERLNTGGTQLNAMEIRRAMFHGDASRLLDKLNENSDWRALLGMPLSEPRFRDVELILRILALAENWRDYSGQPMKSFLNRYMAVLFEADPGKMAQLECRFAKACKLVREELEDKPFHLHGRLNLAALDSVMACSVELCDSLKPGFGLKYAQLKEDPRFQAAVTYNTSHTAEVQQRFELVRTALSS